MFLDLQRIPLEGQKVDRSLAAKEFSFDPSDFRLRGPVTIHGHLARVDEAGFRLTGRLGTTLEVVCVRCLESFSMVVSEELELLYLPQSRNVAPEGEEERGLEDEELAVSFYRDDQIDLEHLVLEQIVLSLPMKPLCRVDCAGLCAICGSNRNVERCQCSAETTDPRWSGLRSLLG